MNNIFKYSYTKDLIEHKLKFNIDKLSIDQQKFLSMNFTDFVLKEMSWFGDEDKRIEFFNESYNTILEKIENIQSNRDRLDTFMNVGDVVYINGERYVVSIDYKDECQLAKGGSIYISNCGHCSFSGTCGDTYKKCDFIKRDETEEVQLWNFLLGSGANMGINFKVNVNVFEAKD